MKESLGSGIGQVPITVSPSADPRRPDVPNLENENAMGYKLSHASAFAGRELSPTLRFVLRTICDYTNDKDDTNECYPSVPRIMESTSFSERTVRKAIADLQEHGYLTVTHQPGKRNRYFVHLKQGEPLREMHPCETFPPAPDAPLPLREMQGTPAPDAPPYKPVNNRSKKTSSSKVEKKPTPPTLEQLKDYLKGLGIQNIDYHSKAIMTYYNARDWHDSKGNPIQRWKTNVANWVNKGKANPKDAPLFNRHQPHLNQWNPDEHEWEEVR